MHGGWNRLCKERQPGKHLLHCDTASATVCKQILHNKIQLKIYLWSVKEKSQRHQHHSLSVPNYHTSGKKNCQIRNNLNLLQPLPVVSILPLKCLGGSQVHSHKQVSATAWRLPTESMLLRSVSLTHAEWQLLVKSPDKSATIYLGTSQMETNRRDFRLCLCLLMSCTEKIGLPHHPLQSLAKCRVCGCFQQPQKAQLCFV